MAGNRKAANHNNSPSVSCTQASLDQTNRPVIDLLASWLGDLGFAIDIQQVSPGKFNLLASFGSGPGGLVLSGHSDTVPYDAALWKTDPLKLTEVDGRWVGLGSCDMKGFFALAIEAVLPLLDQPFKQPLLILATCDEESTAHHYSRMSIALHWLMVLLFVLIVMRRNACSWSVPAASRHWPLFRLRTRRHWSLTQRPAQIGRASCRERV